MSSGKAKLLKILLPSLAVTALVILLLIDSLPPKVQSREYYGYFDTVSTLYDHSGDEDFLSVADRVDKMMRDYHELYNIHEEYAGKSNLCTLNRSSGEWVLVDEEIIRLLEWGIEIYELTGGEVNIAMGSVTTLWKESLKDGELPSATELDAASRHTDITKIEINKDSSAVRLADPEMLLDVGAVAKGFAEEAIASWLAKEGKRGYALDMGGNLRVIGTKPSGEGFTTGIRNPDTSVGGFIETLTLTDQASATSGGYERYYDVGGNRYHHIIDKDVLAPAGHYLSATVITKSASLADALSTAVFCMAEEEVVSLVDKVDESIRIIIVKSDGSILRFDN